ncbi:MAG: MFS transporter [Candidatus Eisenbacteria bacterium]|nr:MFS transporter [Candidatus Eisenbacteria bacterium]
MAWGLVGAFAPQFREQFGLSATETALLVAFPVLLGSLARIPMGMLTDRFGGRLVFTVLMLASAAAAATVPLQVSYTALLMNAFLLGLAGASFAVGVPFVASWTPPERRGGALGIYGLGTGGQSAAVFLGPLVGAAIGMTSFFRATAAILIVWALIAGRRWRRPGSVHRWPHAMI